MYAIAKLLTLNTLREDFDVNIGERCLTLLSSGFISQKVFVCVCVRVDVRHWHTGAVIVLRGLVALRW